MSAATTKAELEALRLPDLRARYIEVVGEDTRCPNRSWLIRKIEEALATRPSATPTATAPSEQNASSPEDGAELEVIDEHCEETAENDDQRPEFPNAGTTQAPPTGGFQPDPSLVALALERGRLASMTVEELQGKYREIVGRETDSTHRAYLIWKIKEAAKGRVPIGPREAPAPSTTPRVTKTIPLGFAPEVLEALDEVWKRRQLASRSDLFRRALASYLRSLDEHATAALFESRNNTQHNMDQ